MLVRSIVGVLTVMALAVVLVSRVRAIASEPRLRLAPRVVQLMYNRMLAQRIQAYARAYGRPPYAFDSVLAHLDSAETDAVLELRTDLWGGKVYYGWTWCDFTIGSDVGGAFRRLPPASFDSLMRLSAAHGRFGVSLDIREDYSWPPGVGRKRDCLGGP